LINKFGLKVGGTSCLTEEFPQSLRCPLVINGEGALTGVKLGNRDRVPKEVKLGD
jgi:hypothetical protein